MFRSQKSLTVPSRTKEKSALLAPCINCEEFVAFDQIDQHARICTAVAQRVLKVTRSSDYFDENDFKLNKLRTNIQNKKYKHTSRLCRIIEIVTQINTIGCVEEASLIQFEQELQQMSQEPSQSINQSLYIERLHSLILQRISIIQSQMNQKLLKPSQSQQNFYLPNSSTQVSKESRNSNGPTQPNKLQNLVQKQDSIKNLYQCRSPDPRMTYITKFSQNSPVSYTQNLQQQKSEILTHISEQVVDNLEEQSNPQTFAQRCFYSKVLNIKLTYPQYHAAQKIPVSILWKQAERKQVKPDQWDNFIRQCLDSPFQYIDPSKFNNQRGKKN